MVIHRMMHVTPVRNIDSIREQGLLARDPSERWPGDAQCEPHVGVYVTTSKQTVRGMEMMNRTMQGAMGCVAFYVNVAGLPMLEDRVQPETKNRWCIPHDVDPERLLGCSTVELKERTDYEYAYSQ